MNRIRSVAACAAFLLAFAVPVPGQVKYGGYLSLEYINGGAATPYSRGRIDNLLAGFMASGSMAGKVAFTLEARTGNVPEPGTDQSWSFELDQAWVGFGPSKAVTVKAGLFIVPFGIYNQSSRPHETSLIEVPLNLEYLYPRTWRDIGVVAEGRTGFLSYSAYLSQGLGEFERIGSGQQFRDNNTDWAWGGRIGFDIGDSGRAGVSYYKGKYDEMELHDLILEGVDLSWVSGQWAIRGEYTKSIIENPQPFERGRSEGFYIWMGMVAEDFQPYGSYQQVEVDDPFRGEGIVLDQSRWTAGLRYVMSSTLFVKVEYVWNTEKVPIPGNDRFQVQAALSF